jgi:cellobiose dehydrogenase (acceptor)
MRVLRPLTPLLALLLAATAHAQQVYDAIVVGSGPGGLVAAEFISRDPTVSVLILEAGLPSLQATGGSDAPDYAAGSGLTKFDIPAEYDSTIYNPANDKYRVDWIDGPYMWLGKLVGGCSSINAALYFRPSDAYLADTKWPFTPARVAALMDDNERLHAATTTPSKNGQWYTQEGFSVVSKALKDFGGYSESPDLNSAAGRNARGKTFGHAPYTIRDGRRDTPANAFWGAMKTRANVKLLTSAMVDYVVHTNGKASAVVYNGGTRVSLTRRGVVVMGAGALSTPKVLIQSGIGPQDQLSLLSSKFAAQFPGVVPGSWVVNDNVGRSVFDTNVVFASFSHPNMVSFQAKYHPSWAVSQYMTPATAFTGPWASPGPMLIAFDRYDVAGHAYDFQATVLPVGFGDFYARSDALTTSLYVNNPVSRVRSAFSADTGKWLAFAEGDAYFGTSADLAAMQSFANKVVDYMTRAGGTFLSGKGQSVSDWVAASDGLITHHFGGSCYTSSDAGDAKRCADDKLRVVGTTNVFVGDASAMKEGTTNPYGFVMYIGREAGAQAADYIAANSGGATTCAAVESGVDYVGNDVGSAASAAVDGCCALCKARADCGAYTWTNHNGGTCWLKSAKGSTKADAGAKSGVLTTDSTPSTCPAVENGIDYVDNDVGSAASPSVDGCCALCKAKTGCGAYSWTNHNGGTCWLKSSKGSTKVDASVKSGVISSSTTPTPTPTPTPTTATPSTCALVANTDYYGNDLISQPSAAASGCCALCKALAGCKAFTWTGDSGGTCWLKSAKGSASVKAGAQSGEVATSSSCSAVEENVDYSGNDVGSALSASVDGCCALCQAKTGCGAYTWTNFGGGTCWLKSSKGSTVSKSGARSAVLTASTGSCTLVNGVDYFGNDLTSAASGSASGCCDLCRAKTGCKAFTWASGTCYLKSASTAGTAKAGVVSGVV